MLTALFGKSENDFNPYEKMCKDFLEEVINIAHEIYSPIISLMPDIYEKCGKSKVTNSKGNVDTMKLYDSLTSELTSQMNQQTTNEKMATLTSKIRENREALSVSQETNNDEFNAINIFKAKFNLVKLYVTRFTSVKKEVRILALGPSQVGKTAMVKRLFNLNNSTIKLKGGLESDTSFIRQYQDKINGITFCYTDCPGFFDSRGEKKDKENMEELTKYVKENEIDIIFWVFKINDILDLKYQEKLVELTKQFGTAMWKKSIVILTHANELPSEEYYYNEDGEYDDLITDAQAWTQYTNEKKKKWQSDIPKIICSKIDVPILLTENNPRKINKINDIGCLIDGTPILESMMLQIFKTIEEDKAPIMFLALGNGVENEKPPNSGTKGLAKPVAEPAKKPEVKNAPKNVLEIPVEPIIYKPPEQLGERARALNKVMRKFSKTDNWFCNIFNRIAKWFASWFK